MDTLPNNGTVAAPDPKLMLAVTADAESLTIAMLVTATAISVGDVYSVVLEVAAAPLKSVKVASAISYSSSAGAFGSVNTPSAYVNPIAAEFSTVYSTHVFPDIPSAIASESATMQFSTTSSLITANVATICIPFLIKTVFTRIYLDR